DYNSELKPIQMLTAARLYREKDRCSLQAVPYGYGDGGGGPTAGHLERLRRYRDLEGMPRLIAMDAERFFRRLAREAKDLRAWVGELYLEYHRGTLTTQAHNKRNNRKSEVALRDVECLSALCLAMGGRYRQEEINRAWKTVLLNQFHDILPGSSIAVVYRDSHQQYAEVLKAAAELRQEAISFYSRQVDTRGDGAAVLLVNTLGWDRREAVALALPERLRKQRELVAVAADGRQTPVQLGADGLSRFLAEVPSLGHAVYHIRPGKCGVPSALVASPRCLENEYLRLEFDPAGRLTRIYDRERQREVLAAGGIGNQFQLFEDKPHNFDAWDVDFFYQDKLLQADGALERQEVLERGPVRAVLRQIRRISKSRIVQDIALAAGARRVDFITTVEWGDEKEVILKVAFPVAVHAEQARYEIQFGSLERPTHTNMPADFARFEVAAHKWADLSEAGYGVALLNDCKYGHSIRGQVIRLSLLRAPKSPDPDADVRQTHSFTYSLMPHGGDFRQGVVREAYQLNVPLLAAPVSNRRGALPPVMKQMWVEGEGIVIESVKKAEDDHSVIVRLYEAHGGRGEATLGTALPARAAYETDLLEREERRLPLRDGRVRLAFAPFQIRTVKIEI
ncbi:MAG: glycosyl hydrolase-related protein, partial [Planctomycetota bacterium]|nr:glycosyl hydrolase-related protein [Planctomycetota bacterium]